MVKQNNKNLINCMGVVDMTPEDFIHVFGLLALITQVWSFAGSQPQLENEMSGDNAMEKTTGLQTPCLQFLGKIQALANVGHYLLFIAEFAVT